MSTRRWLLAGRTRRYRRSESSKVLSMPRRLPPLNALRAFEVAARHENFTRAAEELGVSQVAVSQQVKSLEATLALKLFARDGKRLVITSAGKQYLAVVRDALDRIAVGTDRLLKKRPSSVLTVSTSPDFGRLVVPIDVALPLENTYWIVYPKLASRESKIVALRDWLLSEAADDERRMRALAGKGYAGTKRCDPLRSTKPVQERQVETDERADGGSRVCRARTCGGAARLERGGAPPIARLFKVGRCSFIQLCSTATSRN
jgi:DNA-binding transcriptional ArsR family regulator